MEILQIIWNALTTENVMVLKLTSMPMLILELTVSMLLFTTILDINSNKKNKIIYVVILSLIGFLNLWIIPDPFNTVLNLIACPICVYFIFKTNILKAILAEIIPYVFFIILSEIVVNIYTIIFKISNQVFGTITIYKMTSSLLIYFFVYLIYRFIKYFKISIKNIRLSKTNTRFIIN